jgi:CDP-diacylglycerol--glycerol-3-phosphate 3-phosphatidyltransferase
MIDGRRGRSASATNEHDTGPGEAGKPDRKPRFALGARLHRRGVSADQITVLGLFLAATAAVFIALGWFPLAVAVGTVGCLMDALDGAVAKAAGPTSKRGAFFDSTSDRVGDALIFGGVAWFFAAGHHPLLALLPLAILATANLVSYERAKAESLGFVAKGGLMERAERLIFLGVVLLFGWAWSAVLLIGLIVLLTLTVITATQRFAKVWRQATAEMKGIPEAEVAIAGWRPGRVESRWRAWRQTAHLSSGTNAAGRKSRVATTPSSRGRARREVEPLASRVRKAWQAERVGRASVRSSSRPARQPRPKASRSAARWSTRWSTGGGLRRRYDSSR